jgi:kumamolisin
MQNVNEALHLAALSGITICAASGDDGARNQVNDGKPHVDFPASSPWVLAIGGTRLIAEKDSIKSEVVWSGTGGGVSDVFPQPEWQSGVKVPARADGQPGRGVPDVAANADPETGYMVEIDGQWAVIGGTSATAPLWAGLIALLNQGLGRPIGYLNPVLYKNIGSSGAFHGIVTGNNGVGGVKGYSAGPGWNACTGWGSPDGKRLLEALRKAVESRSQT